MNLLERLKLLGELSKAIKALKEEKDALKRLRLTQQIQKLRIALGLIKESKDENEIDPNNLTELVLPTSLGQAEKRQIVTQWIKQNLFNENKITDNLKFIKTTDGKKVYFNANASLKKMVSTSSRMAKSWSDDLGFKAIAKIPEVFSTGKFIEFQKSYKERPKDNFIGFHVYRKRVEIGENIVELEVKAGERPDGTLEIAGTLIGYTFNIKEIDESLNSSPMSSATDTKSGGSATTLDSSLSPSSSKIGTPLGELTTGENHTLSLDNIQEEDDFLVQILRVWDKFGNVLL